MRKLFYICWAIAFIYSVCVILGAKVSSIGSVFIHKHQLPYEGTREGDLFHMCKIDKFKLTYEDYLRLMPDSTDNTEKEFRYTAYRIDDDIDSAECNLESADILIFGDSALGRIRSLIIQSDKLKVNAIYAYNLKSAGFDKGGYNPLKYFNDYKPNNKKMKVVIIQTSEPRCYMEALWYDDYRRNSDSIDFEKQLNKFYANDHLEYFFTDNLLGYYVFNNINTVKYNVFSEIDKRIGLYNEEHRMLIHKWSVNFVKMQKPKSTYDAIIDNVNHISKELQNKYNSSLIYAVVPEKFVIYSDYLQPNFKYDNFLPKLNRKLTRKGIQIVDLYSPYMEYRKNDDSKLLYQPDDVHYSMFAEQMFLDLLVEKIIDVYSAQTDSLSLTY